MRETAAYAHDWSPAALLAARSGSPPGAPLRVERPRSTEEVAAVLKRAHDEHIPVVPYGGGSGVVGGIRSENTVVVDLTAMDRVLEIDERSRLVTAQAGISGPALRSALLRRGHTLGHEPQSIELSTLGGWIATRACGQLSARYGGIETMVAGLEAVLPGGRVVRSKPAPRRATGPDVASLMIGSEGALGIVTEACLRFRPLTQERADAVVRFEHMSDGVAACRAIAQSELRPTVVRLYDREDASLFLRAHPEEEQGPLLILSFEGSRADDRAAFAVEASRGRRGNDRLAEHWWTHRNNSAAEFREIMAGRGLLGPHALVDTMEVAGTWSVLRDLYHRMKDALAAESTFAACHLSHVYPDGACLYFTMGAACSDDTAAREVHARWWEVGMRACLDSGGAISHHHGIGRLRAPWIEEELGGWYAVLKAVKHGFDPHGIMNPGVLGL